MPASVNVRLDGQWCDENRRLSMTFAWGPAEHPVEPLPAPARGQEQEPVPVARSSPSSVVPAAAIPVPFGAGAAPSDGDHRSFLPSHVARSSPRSSDGASGRDRRRDRGDRSRESSASPVSSRTRRRLARTHTGTPCAVLNGDESRAASASAPVSRRRPRVGGKLGQPRGSKKKKTARSSPQVIRRKAFRRSLASRIPVVAENRPEPLAADAHPGLIPPHAGHTGNRFGSPAAVELLLRENGIEPSSQLKPHDAALADATPNVTTARFAALFRGQPQHERPRSLVRNILCIDRVVHPYAPSAPGESGVIFFAPGTVLFEDNYPSFHIFLNVSPQTTKSTKRRFYYLGAYCKVPSASQTVEAEEWLSLPTSCRDAWKWRIHSTTLRDVRATHARISIRNGRPHGPTPSQDEIEEWLERHPKRYEGLGGPDLMNAFNKGEERINFILVKCIEYDVGVAMSLQ